jgi:hypothetical protein
MLWYSFILGLTAFFVSFFVHAFMGYSFKDSFSAAFDFGIGVTVGAAIILFQ